MPPEPLLELRGLDKRVGGVTVIDKNLSAVLHLAGPIVLLENGRSAWAGASEALGSAQAIRDRYLHL